MKGAPPNKTFLGLLVLALGVGIVLYLAPRSTQQWRADVSSACLDSETSYELSAWGVGSTQTIAKSFATNMLRGQCAQGEGTQLACAPSDSCAAPAFCLPVNPPNCSLDDVTAADCTFSGTAPQIRAECTGTCTCKQRCDCSEPPGGGVCPDATVYTQLTQQGSSRAFAQNAVKNACEALKETYLTCPQEGTCSGICTPANLPNCAIHGDQTCAVSSGVWTCTGTCECTQDCSCTPVPL